jgi:hypothetical protein
MLLFFNVLSCPGMYSTPAGVDGGQTLCDANVAACLLPGGCPLDHQVLTYTIPNLDDVCVPTGNGSYVASVGNPSNNYTCGADAVLRPQHLYAKLLFSSGDCMLFACGFVRKHFQSSVSTLSQHDKFHHNILYV